MIAQGKSCVHRLRHAALWIGCAVVAFSQTLPEPIWDKPILAGRAAFEHGEFTTADRFLPNALQRHEAAGLKDGTLARELYELGAMRLMSGLPNDALRLITRAIKILEAEPRPDLLDLSSTWSALGTSYLGTKSYMKAADAFQKSLELRQMAGVTRDSEAIATLGGLVKAYTLDHRYRDAESVLHRARELTSGDDLTRLFLVTHWGALYAAEGHLREAETAFRQAVAIADATNSSGDGLVIKAARPQLLNALAWICFKRRQYTEAEVLFAKAAEFGRNGTPLSPADFAQILHNYALCLHKMDKKVEARKQEGDALAIWGSAPQTVTSSFLVDVGALMRRK